MAKKVRPIKKFVSNNLSDAILKTVEDVANSGYDLTEIVEAVDKEKIDIPSNKKFVQSDLAELTQLNSQAPKIPGQSLTNNPNNPYPWEQPPKFANPREALQNILNQLLEPEATKNIVFSLADGMSVSDIATTVGYVEFIKGNINPDVMFLVIEPLMYLIMSIGEEAGINYNIETNDANELDEEETFESIAEFEKAFDEIRNSEQIKNVSVEKIDSGVVPRSLLEQVKEKGPEIKSLLGRQE